MTDTLTPGSETAWISHAALCNTVGDHLLIRKRPSVDFDKGQIYSHALPIPLLPVCLLSPLCLGYLLFLPCICIWGVDVAPMKSPVSGALLGSSYWVTSRQTPKKGPKGGLLMQLTFNEWGTQTFSSKTEQIVSFFSGTRLWTCLFLQRVWAFKQGGLWGWVAFWGRPRVAT